MVCNGILYYNYYCIILLQCVCVYHAVYSGIPYYKGHPE